MVGDVADDGKLNVIGVGQARSRGVRKGEIIDPALAEEDLRTAISEAELSADAEIRSVYLGVSGAHIRGFVNRGYHPVVSADREITHEDVEDVVKNAKAINLPAENTVIHSIRQNFLVDEQDGIPNPVGMLGSQLKVDVHVVHGNFNRLQNPIRVVKGMHLEVESIVFNGLASALATLTNEQKELGALVIDMGGGTTEYAVYSEGVVKHTGALAVGGDHVTNDLAYGLRVPQSRAERLKREFGAAVVRHTGEPDAIQLTSQHGLPMQEISRENLLRIMSLRLEETFELILEDLIEKRLVNYLRAGVFIAGGCSNIPLLPQLAGEVFGMHAFVARPGCMSNLPSSLQVPEFVAAMGLLKFGALQSRRKARTGLFGNLADTIGSILKR